MHMKKKTPDNLEELVRRIVRREVTAQVKNLNRDILEGMKKGFIESIMKGLMENLGKFGDSDGEEWKRGKPRT